MSAYAHMDSRASVSLVERVYEDVTLPDVITAAGEAEWLAGEDSLVEEVSIDGMCGVY